MRLAIVRQRYNPYGGAERFVERALAALARQGASVTVISRQWADAPGGAASGEGPAPVTEWIRCDPFHIGRRWRDASFARSVCRELASHPFDLVQAHERIACCDLYRAGDGVHKQWLANRARTLTRVDRMIQWLSPYHRYVLGAERRLFASPRLRAVICNSHMVRNEIQRHFRIDEAKLHVVYSGVDLDRFHPGLRSNLGVHQRQALGIESDAFVYVFVGSGFERKGVGRLLHAFQRAGVGPPARVIVVGKDKEEPSMRKLAHRLGIASRVHFAGGQEDVRGYYAAANCFVLPTLYDPLPNAALEALACGLPIITTTQCGAAELIEGGNTGYVCDALDLEALARALRDVQSLPAKATCDAARQAVEGLTLDAMAAKMVTLYEQLTARIAMPGVKVVQ
ncbi:MAG: glycosyltransferase family 4 protein [Burkholderiales bacterium]